MGISIYSTGEIKNSTLPCFRAYMNGNQAVSNATQTKVAFNAESFDTASCYDTTTYRFTPNVPGYYFIHALLLFGSMGGVQSCSIYKNGSRYVSGDTYCAPSNTNNVLNSAFMYMNGTTDYVEIYAYQASTATINLIGNLTTVNEFSAFFVRAA